MMGFRNRDTDRIFVSTEAVREECLLLTGSSFAGRAFRLAGQTR